MDLMEEAFENKISLRRFGLLVAGLPEDSAYVRFMRNRKNRDMAEIGQIDDTILKR